MNKQTFFGKVRLYKKTLRLFDDGTRGVHWHDLGSIPAYLHPYKTLKDPSMTLPFLVMLGCFSADKVLWNHQEYIYDAYPATPFF